MAESFTCPCAKSTYSVCERKDKEGCERAVCSVGAAPKHYNLGGELFRSVVVDWPLVSRIITEPLVIITRRSWSLSLSGPAHQKQKQASPITISVALHEPNLRSGFRAH